MQQGQLGFVDDRPISLPEQDELHRAPFAERLARGLILEKDASSLVIGLEAPWGWGKTSVINLAKRSLASRDAVIVDFQPWLIGPREALVQSFLIQLAAAIQVKDKAKEGKAAAEQLLKYSSIFNVLKLIPGAEPWATITHQVAKGVGKAAKDVSQLKQLDVAGQRKKVVEALAKIDRPIVVVVDDLDRLPPNEVFEILRFVKAVADFDRVSYLLAYDHLHVTEALASIGVPNGAKFLEKIIQVRLHLPPVGPLDARHFFERRMGRFNHSDQAQFFPKVSENIADIYLPYLRRLLDSPRTIVRLINRLEVSYRMTFREVVFGDLLGLESLAILVPHLYEEIRARPERFLGSEDLSFGELLDDQKPVEKVREFREGVFKTTVPSALARDVRGLVDKLFPLGGDYVAVSLNDARKNGNIVEISRLRIALNLGPLPDDISLDVVRLFLSAPSERMSVVESLPESIDVVERFIELVSDFVDGADVEDPKTFSLALASILNRRQFKDRLHRTGPADVDMQLASCLEGAIKSAETDSKRLYFLALLESDSSAWLAMRAVELIVRREEQKRPLLPPDEEELILRKWEKSIALQLHSGELLEQPYAGPALFAWRRVEGGSFRDEIRAFAVTDENFVALATVLGNSVVSSSSGRIARWGADLVADLGDESGVRSRANTLLTKFESLSRESKAALLALGNNRSYVVRTLQPTQDW